MTRISFSFPFPMFLFWASSCVWNIAHSVRQGFRVSTTLLCCHSLNSCLFIHSITSFHRGLVEVVETRDSKLVAKGVHLALRCILFDPHITLFFKKMSQHLYVRRVLIKILLSRFLTKQNKTRHTRTISWK